MGDFNQSVVFEAIRRSDGGLSRIEISEATGLSAQTVTNIVRRLLERGFVREAGRTISGPGKPRTSLELVPRSRVSVGVHLDPAFITGVLLDLAGSVIARRVRRTPTRDPEHILRAMVEIVAEVIAAEGIDSEIVAGVGVAAPGPLDIERGTVIEPPKLHEWHRVPLRDALAEEVRLPVTLEKDTTAAAFAELWTGADASDVSLLFVYIGTGIGTALVIDGEVLRGVSRNVGEVGHIIVDPQGPPCGCGMRGCVEVVCTPQAIVERAERAGAFGGDDDGAGSVDERFTRLCERARRGDTVADQVLVRAAEHLSTLISVLTNMLDLDRVVLGGPFWGPFSEICLRELPAFLAGQNATRGVRGVAVSGSAVGEDVGAVGAACVVLDDILAPRAATLLLDPAVPDESA